MTNRSYPHDVVRFAKPDTCILFVGTFAVYLYCAYPALAPRDSADLALAALNLGVAHPPGYPLYSVLGRLWIELLPLGNPAYRLNILSALAGAGAVVCVFAGIKRAAGFWPGMGAALSLAFSVSLWKFSLLSEMYSLHALFIAALVLLAEGPPASIMKRSRLSALLFGLGLVNHQSLILLLPPLLFLWRAELKRKEVINARGFPLPIGELCFFFVLGLALYGAVALRLRLLSLAWSVITRAEYGSLQLFGGFSRPLSEGLAGMLLGHLATGLFLGGSSLIAAAACLGAWETFRRRLIIGLAAFGGLALFGPLFFLMIRFDISNWVAQTVLEPAFIIPTLFLCVLGGIGLKLLPHRVMISAALAAAIYPLWLHGSLLNHRDDFSAYDYIRDLRAALPPGSAAIVGGDTALFGLKYWESWKQEPPDARQIVSARELDLRRWIDNQLERRPVFVLGLPLASLRQLGLLGNSHQVFPVGSVQRLGNKDDRLESAAWQMSVLRKGRSMENGESYAHDIRLAYAFAHYLSAQLATNETAAGWHSQWAAVWDPEDYQLAP